MNNKISNLRDMTNITFHDGKHLKPNTIIRCTELSSLNKNQKKFIDSLNLNYIFDFRTFREINERKDYVPKNATYVHCPMYDGDKYDLIEVTRRAHLRVIHLKGDDKKLLVKSKIEGYKEMPFSIALNNVFEAMDQGKTFLFHCTEGKDRTGICAALILFALGSSETDILNDYLASNLIRPPKDRSKLKHLGISQEIIDGISFCETTSKELFDASKNSILSSYQTIDEFLEKHFNIDKNRIENWKKLYLI